MKVKSDSEVAQSCPTPSDPMDCSLSGFSVHGIFQARVLEWGAIAFSIRGAIAPKKLNKIGKILCEVKVALSYLTLRDPMEYKQSMEFFRPE